MKILHALVGYLAVTALPFALAYPLAAIDYDGYVNTAQNHIDGALMKLVLGTIAETCQTVTTQNHSDSVLMQRAPDDIIVEARQGFQVDPALPVVLFLAFIVADVTFSIL